MEEQINVRAWSIIKIGKTLYLIKRFTHPKDNGYETMELAIWPRLASPNVHNVHRLAPELKATKTKKVTELKKAEIIFVW